MKIKWEIIENQVNVVESQLKINQDRPNIIKTSFGNQLQHWKSIRNQWKSIEHQCI